MAIPFDAIASAKLILTDKLIKATKPLIADDDATIVEDDGNDENDITEEEMD
jgi:hypothetical protein